jgi:uncharacterized protein YycO
MRYTQVFNNAVANMIKLAGGGRKFISAVDLEDGDLLLYRPGSLYALGISLFTGSPYGHAGIYNKGRTVEMLASGGRKRSIAALLDNPINDIDVYRPDAEKKKRKRAANRAAKLLSINADYGEKSISDAFWNRLTLGKLYDQERKGMPIMDKSRHCSELVNDAYALAGIPIDERPSYLVTPGDLVAKRGAGKMRVKALGKLIRDVEY